MSNYNLQARHALEANLIPLGSTNEVSGAEGDRTPDLMTASHALSQLSYGPGWGKGSGSLAHETLEGERYGAWAGGRGRAGATVPPGFTAN